MSSFDFSRRCLGAAALAAALVGVIPAAADQVDARLEIEFSGSSTLHNFEGNAAGVTVAVMPAADDANRWSAEIAVPVASLDTGNGTRDGKMRTMFDADRFSDIRAVLSDIDPTEIRKSGKLPFILVIRDVERDAVAELSHWQQSDDEVSFDASFDVSLEDFNLKAPGVLFIRVSDRVTVTLHATIRRT